jgi:hypothetical protein
MGVGAANHTLKCGGGGSELSIFFINVVYLLWDISLLLSLCVYDMQKHLVVCACIKQLSFIHIKGRVSNTILTFCIFFIEKQQQKGVLFLPNTHKGKREALLECVYASCVSLWCSNLVDPASSICLS